MFHIRGPLSDTSPLFVGRQSELKIIDGWITHGDCVGAVLGGRQNGKTSLLLRLRKRYQGRCGFALVDFQAVSGASPDDCARYIGRRLVAQLYAEPPPADLAIPERAAELTGFFERLCRAVTTPRLLIAFDELGALSETTRRRLGSSIRAHFTGGALDATLRRILFVLAGGREMLAMSVEENSPLRNVTDGLHLSDLSVDHTRELLECGGSAGLAVQAEAIHQWTGGHPYWTQLLAMSSSGGRAVDDVAKELLQIEAANLPHVMSALARNEALNLMVRRIVSGERVAFTRAHPQVAELELLGIVCNRSGACAIRNRIYLEAARTITAAEPGRAEETPTQARAPATQSALNVLFLAANPIQTARITLGEEARAVELRLRAAQRSNAMTVVTSWATRPDDLQRTLLEHRPVIVHFSGHGEGEAGIVLHGDQPGELRHVSADALRHLFGVLKERIRVVVLNACYSEVQARAIADEIDCVVGMRQAVRDTSARVFAAAFYRGLAYGCSIRRSFDLGVNAIKLEGLPDQDVPILLTRQGMDAAGVFVR